MAPFNITDHSIWHHSSWHISVNLKTTSPHGITLDIVDNIMALQDSSTSTLPEIEDFTTFKLLQRRHHSFTCIEKIRLRTSDSASAEDSWTDSVTSVPSDCLRQLSPESRSFSKCETRIGIGF